MFFLKRAASKSSSNACRPITFSIHQISAPRKIGKVLPASGIILKRYRDGYILVITEGQTHTKSESTLLYYNNKINGNQPCLNHSIPDGCV